MAGSSKSSPLRQLRLTSPKLSPSNNTKKASTRARISTGGRPPRAKSAVLVQPGIAVVQLSARLPRSVGGVVHIRVSQLRRPLSEYELGTGQKYIEDFNPDDYKEDSWAQQKPDGLFTEDAVARFLSDVGFTRVHQSFSWMGIRTDDDLLIVALDTRQANRRGELREALNLSKEEWVDLRRAIRDFARPIHAVHEVA
ncbi:hypothetical protein BDZ89DRAFT_1152298 [Hymenopellis radicata]|nr:hypothetical protein BDZ89DRAFT_1152298 [Hymenopellis radicata]